MIRVIIDGDVDVCALVLGVVLMLMLFLLSSNIPNS